MESRNAKFGFILFGIYLVLYGGFVLLNAFSPETMEEPGFAGVNLAVLCGFGLIVAALILALIYGTFCKTEDDQTPEENE